MSIHGEKIWSGSAAWAGVTNVFVQHQELDGKHRGISAFALRRGTPGLRQGKEALTMGMRGMVQNTVHFDGAIAAEKQLLGKVGKGMEVAQDAMMHGRLAISWSCLGGMKRCAQLMLRYTSRRQISTGRLLDNPLILNRLGGLTTKITAVECLVTQIAKLLDYQVKIPVELYTACKTSAPEFYWQAADDLVQFLGGRGYIETNIAPQILRDARVLRIFEGPTETLNMFLGSRVVSSDQDFADFLKNNFNAAEIHEKLLGAVKQINKRFADNPLFEKNLDNKRWIYILIGEIATYAILLAASKYSYSQQPTTEIKRAIAWAELQLQQKIDKALVVTPDELVTVTADLTSELINSYQEAIGDVQQNLAGEDWELDELLAVEQGSKELNSKRITETLVRRGEQRWKPASTKGARECPPREGEKRGEVSNTNKGELDKNKSVQDWLSQWLGKKLEIPQEKIDRSKSFADYGMDSVMAVELAEDLEQWLPNSLELEPTLAWNFPSIEALAGYLSEQGGQEVQESRGLNEAELQKTQEQGEQEKLNNLSEDELARSLMQEIALAKRRDN
ncbi:MAG: acyl-CoA dehydrogenase family protein [Cyanobacteria bacterium J06642_3]